MPVNDLHIQIATARAPLHKVDTRKGVTYRGLIETDEGRKRAYLKLLAVEDIAREVLCAILARKVHLPIRPCYYVNVDSTLTAQDVFINPQRVAFGIEEDVYPTFRGNSRELDEEILKWEDALKCAVFDEWIYNRDRNPANLVYVSSGVWWLIDHDDALRNDAAPDSSCGSYLLYKLAEGQSEFNRHKLKQSAMLLVEQYQAIDWEEILHLVRPEILETSLNIYKKYIEFLKQRISYLPNIITERLGIRQRELGLQNSQNLAKKLKNKDDTSEN